MTNDNPKTGQTNEALTERAARGPIDASSDEEGATSTKRAVSTGQKASQAERTRPAAPANRPTQGSTRSDAARQPKTPAIAKPASPVRPGANPGAQRPGAQDGSRFSQTGGGAPTEQQGDAYTQDNSGSGEVFNQRVFDPTSEDTVVPRGRPAGGGARPGDRGGQRPGGFGSTSQGRGPAQGRPGGGSDRTQGAYGSTRSGGQPYRDGPQNAGRPAGQRGPTGNAGSTDQRRPGGGTSSQGGYQGKSGGSSGGQKRGQNTGRSGGQAGGRSRATGADRLAPPPLTGAVRPAAAAAAAPVTEIVIPEMITVRDLADKMNKSPIEIIKTLMNYGMMIPITESIDFDTAALIGEELGVTVNPEREPEPEIIEEPEEAPKTLRQRIMAEEKGENLEVRPPVVVVLGHVDHGKTTLLDAIREARVVEGEAGGITQHIGAYQVEINGRKITFLDTPGHEAFTAMRARGAMVTDIAILVVAADDGVMPQTKEAIAHVKAAQVPIIVAMNKVDKAQANPDRVKQELADNGVLIEEYGGDVMCVPVSAKFRRGIDDLLESILLAAEIDPQMANPKGDCVGTVIESRLDRTRGPMATLLVQNGTLRVSDSIVSGETYAKIRAMYDDTGETISEAAPAKPVQILGFSDVPVAGETFKVVADERTARGLASERQEANRVAAGPAPVRSLESIFAAAEAGQVKELNLILKADVQGSIEPIVNSLEKLSTDKLKVKILHQGTGNITESDVMLAIASHAIILGFSVTADVAAQRMAEADGIDIRIYNIIYNIIEDVQKALTGLLEPVYKEVVTGHAEIRAVFKVTKVGMVAGCYITDGEIIRNTLVRVKRGGEVVAEDKIAALKRFQEDVAEVKTGFECGIHLANFHGFEVGDILEGYKKERVL